MSSPPVPVMVDASVAVKWVIPEAQSEAALRLGGPSYRRMAAPHTLIEVCNALWKLVRMGLLTPAEAAEAAASVSAPGVLDEIPVSEDGMLVALEIGIRHGRTVYDSVYVALALQEDCPFVTADRRLYDALARVYPETMLWVEDIPALQGSDD